MSSSLVFDSGFAADASYGDYSMVGGPSVSSVANTKFYVDGMVQVPLHSHDGWLESADYGWGARVLLARGSFGANATAEDFAAAIYSPFVAAWKWTPASSDSFLTLEFGSELGARPSSGSYGSGSYGGYDSYGGYGGGSYGSGSASASRTTGIVFSDGGLILLPEYKALSGEVPVAGHTYDMRLEVQADGLVLTVDGARYTVSGPYYVAAAVTTIVLGKSALYRPVITTAAKETVFHGVWTHLVNSEETP